ncbi:MAG: periplasmic sensor signal transduction histidine kinase [Acidobacteriales bacterium]|nr:periplasmic sensor signal transduction histidine kinase [Terriglobales bacterium]
MTRRLRDYPLAKRLTRMNMMVSGTALLVACLAFLVYDVFTFRDAVVRNLTIQAQIIGFNSTSALAFNDPKSAQNTLSALSASSNIMSAGIFTPDGKPFASYASNVNDQFVQIPPLLPGESDAHTFKLNELVLLHTIVLDGKPVGTVYIRSNLQRFYDRLWQYLKILVLVFLGSLIAARIISGFVGKAVAEPIVNLAETAQKVSRDENYSVRAPESDIGGEIALLNSAFNQMLEQIELRDQELQDARLGLEKRVEERTRQLVAANRELEAFSYSVSHDLRNPLEIINGFSYLLLQEYGDKLDTQGKEHLHEVTAATKRMAQLIDDLLGLAQASTTAMHRENVDLSNLALGVMKELQRREPMRKVEFQVAPSMNADGDSRLLRIVLDNLIRNAWKYTSGVTQASVEFGCNRENGVPVFFVRDNGAGFDPQYSDRLFKPFQRLHSKAEFPGTGVGLATVQRIIHRHGGEIWAEGSVQHGATFYFRLQSEEIAMPKRWA